MSVFTVNSPPPAPVLPDPAGMPLERVEAELCTLAGQIAAATSRFLRLLADFDARDGWAGSGIQSCAHWLSWRCGLDLRTAKEHVRVARALQDLPRTREAFTQGRLSYSKVRAISRVATAETEEDLVHAALHNPAAHLERLVRGLKQADRNHEAEDGQRRRSGAADDHDDPRPHVQWRWDDDGCLKMWGKLAAEDGARLLAGLTRMDAERDRSDPKQAGEADACGQKCSAEHSHPQAAGVAGRAPSELGPALVAAAELLCTQVDAPVFAPAADVLVHVDATTLSDTATHGRTDDQTDRPSPTRQQGRLDPATGGTGARLDGGPPLCPVVLQMLACHARTQLAVHAPDGRTLDLGRRHRRPNTAQLQALWRRDRGCTHPGCARTRFLHAHHVTAWAAGGPTNLDNLILLCGQHHRALHDGQFTVTALGKQRFRFHGPNGAERPPAPNTRGSLAGVTTTYPHITPATIEPDWDGTPLDLPHATDVYLTNWARRTANEPRAS
jgi:hypothetical protein